jgi:hypothetical protein
MCIDSRPGMGESFYLTWKVTSYRTHFLNENFYEPTISFLIFKTLPWVLLDYVLYGLIVNIKPHNLAQML